MKIKTYPNNLRLVVNTKKDVDVVSCKIFVTVGAMNELENEHGYAHFLEHMFFKSTKNHSAEEILKKLDDLGASKNAYTGVSKTCYYFKSLSTVFEECLSIFSEMFFNKTFLKDDIQKEQYVVLEEYKMGEDSPVKKCMKNGINSMFHGTSIAHDIVGSPTTIKSITSKKLLNFKQKHYTPNNIIISISGNITFDKAEKFITKYFVNYFDQEIAQPVYRAPNYCMLTPKEKFIVKKKENKQAEVYILIGLKETNMRERIAFNLLFAILGYGMSSKFFETIRGQLGLVYNIDADCTKICNNFLGEILFATSPKNVSKTLGAIKDIFVACANGGITEEELKRIKNQFVSNFIFSTESNSVIAENNAIDLIDYSKIMSNEEITKEYMSITLTEVIECAKYVLNEKNFVVSAVGNILKKQLHTFENV